MAEHTPTPWKLGEDSIGTIFDAKNTDIAKTDAWNVGTHRKPAENRANAAFIVKAVNNHEALVKALEQSKAAMLRTRTASIAGCEEGYGKPEKWADELFASHGDLTASIKAIEVLLSPVGGPRHD